LQLVNKTKIQDLEIEDGTS